MDARRRELRALESDAKISGRWDDAACGFSSRSPAVYELLAIAGGWELILHHQKRRHPPLRCIAWFVVHGCIGEAVAIHSRSHLSELSFPKILHNSVNICVELCKKRRLVARISSLDQEHLRFAFSCSECKSPEGNKASITTGRRDLGLQMWMRMCLKFPRHN